MEARSKTLALWFVPQAIPGVYGLTELIVMGEEGGLELKGVVLERVYLISTCLGKMEMNITTQRVPSEQCFKMTIAHFLSVVFTLLFKCFTIPLL